MSDVTPVAPATELSFLSLAGGSSIGWTRTPLLPPARRCFTAALMTAHGHLALIDIAAEAAGQEPWFNRTLTSVNDTMFG